MVKPWKEELVKELAGECKSAKVLGVADVGRLPSSLMQKVRGTLRGKARVKVAKRSLVERALDEAGKPELKGHVPEKPALIFSDLDAFSLFREIKGQRGAVTTKPGMVASADVRVEKGGTGLPPGPAIGDLQAAGIPAKIEKGQIVVIKDTIILKAGEEATPAIANALNKLDLKPFKLGLEVTAVEEGNLLFEREVLDVDVDEVRSRVASASSQAFSLAYAAGYPAEGVLELLLGGAARQAKALALGIDWVSADTLGAVLSKANAQAASLTKRIGGV
jgi:large subunit ribosomal protein L10